MVRRDRSMSERNRTARDSMFQRGSNTNRAKASFWKAIRLNQVGVFRPVGTPGGLRTGAVGHVDLPLASAH
jgi:hypothetical protein